MSKKESAIQKDLGNFLNDSLKLYLYSFPKQKLYKYRYQMNKFIHIKI